MPGEGSHEANDLEEYEALDAYDTLDGDPGDDPLDHGLAAPNRWSAVMRGLTDADQHAGSLEELLSEEEPDTTPDTGDRTDENTPEQDIRRYWLAEEPDQRAGRLVIPDEQAYDLGDTDLVTFNEVYALDTGIDGGGASAEEAAMYVVDDTEYDDPDGLSRDFP
ncbi:DUF5709 domain-containing protein [Streptomyces sp. NPDC008222]|uniref:DUF5709 domain-containing protein n=1 Tax=Streptomyces sp. NPDC008222 TaxID=3364820 RepID=UPI0036DFCA47